MRKGFMKFRVSRVIPTFHSCRSKDSSSLPTNPVPLFSPHKLNPTHPHPHPPSPHPKSHPSSLKRHVSSALSSDCLRPRPSPEPTHTQSSPPTHHHLFKWIRPKHPHWHVISNYDSTTTSPRRKIYNQNDFVLLPPPPSTKHRVSKLQRQKVRISTSSSDSGIFSDDQTETLVSNDSTGVSKSKDRESTLTKCKSKSKRRSSSFELGNTSPAPARLSEFMRKMTPCRAVVDGKVRESFAVVKKSDDPYEDFKTSMAEMVVEKQIFEERDLEELLRCFLSLNSQRHHEAIVRAFTEIWKGLFCQLPSSPLETHTRNHNGTKI